MVLTRAGLLHLVHTVYQWFEAEIGDNIVFIVEINN